MSPFWKTIERERTIREFFEYVKTLPDESTTQAKKDLAKVPIMAQQFGKKVDLSRYRPAPMAGKTTGELVNELEVKP